MVIIETSIFTRQIQTLLDDEEYRKLQYSLQIRPDLGSLIPGGAGLRKVRWTIKGRGKRGGVRVIYYWAVKQDQILMLFVFAKSEKGDLTIEQVKFLRKIVEEEYP